MLKQIKLKNFRTHKKTKLNFCSGVNGIIGISSSGKTNILRAIKLIFTNRPLGDGMISRFSVNKEAVISTKWSDVGTIKMVKGKDSYYQINNDKPFRKIGTSVPDKIKEALFLSDINFYGQFEGPFLIFSGPGEISRYINKATGAENFDIWTSNVNHRIKNLDFSLKDSDFRIEKYRIEKKKLAGVEKLDVLVRELKRVSKKIKNLQADYDEISELYSKFSGFESKLRMHKKILRFEKTLKKIASIREKIEFLEEDIDLVDDLLNLKKTKHELVKRHKELMKQYISCLMTDRKCPTCYSPIKQSTIKRLKNEIHLD